MGGMGWSVGKGLVGASLLVHHAPIRIIGAPRKQNKTKAVYGRSLTLGTLKTARGKWVPGKAAAGEFWGRERIVMGKTGWECILNWGTFTIFIVTATSYIGFTHVTHLWLVLFLC